MELYLDPQIMVWVFVPLLLGLLSMARIKANVQRALAALQGAAGAEQSLQQKVNAFAH